MNLLKSYIQMKNFILTFFIFCSMSAFAQITREQADTIVFQHIQNEVTKPYLLYINVTTPSAEGIFLTTHNDENMKVKYACWVYYLNENFDINGPAQRRYLLVKENDGNLLEVITSNDFGLSDLSDWEEVSPLGIVEILNPELVQVYPNPTSDELRVTSDGLRVTGVEIYDAYGRMQKSRKAEEQKGEWTLDLSHLQAGIYFLKITTNQGVVTKKVIKN